MSYIDDDDFYDVRAEERAEARREAAYDDFMDRAVKCADCGELYDQGHHRATRTDPGYVDRDECPRCGCGETIEQGESSRYGEDAEWHGTSGGYTNHRCRCQRCRAAFAAWARDWKRRHAGTLEPGDPRHGTENGYHNYTCRCESCTAASTAATTRRNQRRRLRMQQEVKR